MMLMNHLQLHQEERGSEIRCRFIPSFFVFIVTNYFS